MEDFINAYCQELTADMNFRVRAKEIYQFEGMALDPGYADRNAQELVHFYAMCGSYQFGQYANLDPILERLLEKLPNTLPYHNAIAFFQSVMEMDFANQSSYIQLKDLLPYGLSCYGFVFGTSFYAEELYCLHPCDLAYTIIESHDTRKVYTGVLRSQAELRIGRSFQKEKNFYSTIVWNLSRQKEQIEQWIKEAEDKSESANLDSYPPPWEGDL